jgi:membrane fusion protein, multidrug efflux system
MKRRTWLLIVLLVAALALIKIFFLNPKKPGAGGPPQGGKGAPVAVNVVVVQAGLVENKLTLSGNILANEEALLKPEAAGKIISLAVKEGSVVQKGQLLAKLNDASLQAQLKKAQVQLALARERTSRLKQLLEVKGVSQEEFDVAQTALNAAEADVELVKAQIDETEIRAPFAGVIGLRNVSEGSYISNNDIIASIQQIDPVKVDFSVPEKYAGQIKVGDSVRITLEGTRKTHIGKIYAYDPKIEAGTRSLKVRALCNNAAKELFPGSYAQVSLVLRTTRAAVVPSMAVIPDLRGQKAYVVKNGLAQPVSIEAGARTDSSVEVVRGLNPGDTLITSGLMSVKPGSPVKIQALKK